MDRRDFLEQFRERLETVIAESGMSRSAFAAEAGMDRSTLSQLLSAGNDRLPRAEITEQAFVLASAKLPIDTRFVTRLGEEG